MTIAALTLKCLIAFPTLFGVLVFNVKLVIKKKVVIATIPGSIIRPTFIVMYTSKKTINLLYVRLLICFAKSIFMSTYFLTNADTGASCFK